MHKYVVRYTKEGDAKFISHLDFLRAVQRAMRRADLPIKYSEGFNPHPCLSFAQPLGIGVTGENEWFEAEMTEEVPDLASRLDRAMPRGVHIREAILEVKNRFAAIMRAEYLVTPAALPEDVAIAAFLAREEIPIEKRTKSGTKMTDIRPMIDTISRRDKQLFMRIAAGSAVNLKPQTVMDALEAYIPEYHAGFCRYHRLALLDHDNQPIY
ncbi:MAG: TIGR03936 family radical SAM-associated protein [Clostridia bacterium]|nr:TIGR03936 family radical SAM-associated protein [Clostridia bacterium]